MRKCFYYPGQLYFPFIDPLQIPISPADTVILFHIEKPVKDGLAEQAKIQGLSVTRLLNGIIKGYLSNLKQVLPGKKTGRGNIAVDQVEKAKALLREKHPGPVRLAEIANRCGVSQSRAARLVDLLSGGENKGDSASNGINDSFLVYQDDDTGKVGISKDIESGIWPW
jgi:hypothetical protein